ncbi:hypothetical protein ACMA1I_16175 [Pontibacter sp. 13R65]|uniref:hypothetical protein n=1 Tax=Pontibacter sp. 13R65 TaxID=3127458 RepID=UPI00301C8A41
MELSEDNKKALLLSVHKAIEEFAGDTTDNLFHNRTNMLISYPPNGGLTESEKEALGQLKESEVLKSALRKVIASTTADVFFDFFNIVDGTTEPDTGIWSEVLIIDKPNDFEEYREFLHDSFFETYWDWKEIRNNTNWSLDLSEEVEK